MPVHTRLTFTLEKLSTPCWPAHTDTVLVSLEDNYNTTSVKLGCVADVMIAPGST